MAYIIFTFALLLSYSIGSISFAIIFSNIFAKKDVRNFGSGNAGTTNVMRVAGLLPGVLTFVFDALKGLFTCFLAKNVLFPIAYDLCNTDLFKPEIGAFICGVACIMGHAFPVFFGFRGGKGVATGLGIFIICCPKAIILAVSVFLVIMLLSRIVSLSSLCAAAAMIIGVCFFYDTGAPKAPQIALAVLIGAFVFFQHRDNIKRLIKGTEKRLVVRKGE